MRRRTLIAQLAAAPLGFVVAQRRAWADNAPRHRIGLISGFDQATAAEFIDNFREGLRAYGYVEPRMLTLDLLFANFVPERIPELVAEAGARHIDVIVTHA